MHKAMMERPKHEQFRKDRRSKHTIDEMKDDSGATAGHHRLRPPYPPRPPEEDERTTTNMDPSDQNINSQDLVDMINSLHHALIESHNKLESLFQKTTTVLVTQHETMTALISSCKQQLDIVENLVRQDVPDWT